MVARGAAACVGCVSSPPTCDVLVIGSGPAGVSATFPLVAAGLRVTMVDGGALPGVALPHGEFLAERAGDARQSDWMLGPQFEALHHTALALSPKLRVPTLDYVFRGFASANRIEAAGFTPIGSLAAGGLSNAWGCGVARFDAADLGRFPFAPGELETSFEAVARRMGLSGAGADDLRAHFGVDDWADPAVEPDALHRALLDRYAMRRARLLGAGFALGRARVAVLTRARGPARAACSRAGFCLWGCAEGAMYAAGQDLATLGAGPGFTYRPGHVVSHLASDGDGWTMDDGAGLPLRARAVVLAAGTLATTAIALRTLGDTDEHRLLSAPSAAFALWLPRHLGAPRERAAGFAQAAYTLADPDGAICGFTFSTHALPLVEFVRGAPLSRGAALRLTRGLLSSTLVGNAFFSGAYSANRVRLRADGVLSITGGASAELGPALLRAERRLRACFRALGALMLPGSFRAGAAGADAHYAGTLPMRREPARGETDADGAIAGLPGVYVADAAAMPELPAKSHTFAMMAGADRIGRRLALRLASRG